MKPVTFQRFFLMSTALCFLSGCGFTPMYGSGADQGSQTEDVVAALADVEIANIPDRNGVNLRNALIDRFYRNGYPTQPRYHLIVEKVTEIKRELDLTTSSEATRSQLHLSTTIKLFDRSNMATPLLTRTLTSINSYNILESEFATRVTEDSARLSGINDLARQTELNIVLFLNRSRATQ